MLLSPRSFWMKVNGSFYPPSSSGVGTLPTRPDKPSPRRTRRSGTPTRPFERNSRRCWSFQSRTCERERLPLDEACTAVRLCLKGEDPPVPENLAAPAEPRSWAQGRCLARMPDALAAPDRGRQEVRQRIDDHQVAALALV